MLAQWEILDEAEGRKFSPNAATQLLVRGKEATLGNFVVRTLYLIVLTAQ